MKYFDDSGELVIIAVYAILLTGIMIEVADRFLQMFGIL